jgi:hypothetical protein
MRFRADDDVYRARLLYLGPTGYTFPVHLPYAQWGLGVVLAVALTTAFLVVTGDPLWIGATVGGAAFLTSFIFRYVDPDLPARKVISVFLTDWRPLRPAPAKLPRLTAGHIRFRTEITEGQQ